MLRVSRHELVERWALTYCEDGYEVRTPDVESYDPPQTPEGRTADLEATKDGRRVLVAVVDCEESMEQADTRRRLQQLDRARSAGCQLHVVVATECAGSIKAFLQQCQVHPDVVHVT